MFQLCNEQVSYKRDLKENGEPNEMIQNCFNMNKGYLESLESSEYVDALNAIYEDSIAHFYKAAHERDSKEKRVPAINGSYNIDR